MKTVLFSTQKSNLSVYNILIPSKNFDDNTVKSLTCHMENYS